MRPVPSGHLEGFLAVTSHRDPRRRALGRPARAVDERVVSATAKGAPPVVVDALGIEGRRAPSADEADPCEQLTHEPTGSVMERWNASHKPKTPSFAFMLADR